MLPIPSFAPKRSLAGVIKNLFQANEPGVWYDPSDLSTLFQDSAGTTPVTAVEQPVGLMLDKSKGLVLGPELVTNGDFSNGTTGWTSAGTGASIAVVSGALEVTRTQTAASTGYQLVNTVAGKTYRVTGIQRRVSGSTLAIIVARVSADPSSTILGAGVSSSSLTFTQNDFYFSATSTTTYLHLTASTDVGTAAFDNISVRELPGNHAYQSTATTSRPVYSRRVNLLTKTEQFDESPWSGLYFTITSNSAVAPNGTTTADLLTCSSANSPYRTQSFAATANTKYTFSLRVKATNHNFVALNFSDGVTFNYFASWNLSNQALLRKDVQITDEAISSLGDGWYLLTGSLTYSSAAGSANVGVFLVAADGTKQAISIGQEVLVWGASLVPANQASLPYQRVNTSTDYDADPAKFPAYLKFLDDDWLVTPTINFSNTDKMTVFAGIRKLSDATQQYIVSTVNTATVTNDFALQNFTDAKFYFGSGGSTFVNLASGALTAPTTKVLTGTSSISNSFVTLRVDGQQVSTSTATQGTGNFSADPLYIGYRHVALGAYLNGQLYQLIVRGAETSAGQIASAENYINSKTLAF